MAQGVDDFQTYHLWRNSKQGAEYKPVNIGKDTQPINYHTMK
jgi:hypothetical protein